MISSPSWHGVVHAAKPAAASSFRNLLLSFPKAGPVACTTTVWDHQVSPLRTTIILPTAFSRVKQAGFLFTMISMIVQESPSYHRRFVKNSLKLRESKLIKVGNGR